MPEQSRQACRPGGQPEDVGDVRKRHRGLMEVPFNGSRSAAMGERREAGWRGGALMMLLLVAATAPARQAGPDASLAQVKSQMAANLQNLPNYVCLETIERSRSIARNEPLIQTDRLKLDVGHVGARELYAWPGEPKLGELDISTLSGGGLIGNGTFAMRAHVLFETGIPRINFAGRQRLKGRDLLRYDFEIPASSGQFQLSNAGHTGDVGERGSFWADPKTFEVVRIQSEAEKIPAEIGIGSAVSDIEYGRVRIAEKEFLMPARATVELTLISGLGNRNVTTFSACRKYEAEAEAAAGAQVTGGSGLWSEAPPADNKAQPRARPAAAMLPPGLELHIELRTPIDSQKMLAGDRIQGRLTADVMWDGKRILPAGAVVRGRVRRMERLPELTGTVLIGLDFRSVEFENQVANFSAEMRSFQEEQGITKKATTSLRNLQLVEPMPGAELQPLGRSNRQLVEAPSIPGIGFVFLTTRENIPAGFRMVWQTTAPSANPTGTAQNVAPAQTSADLAAGGYSLLSTRSAGRAGARRRQSLPRVPPACTGRFGAWVLPPPAPGR